MDRRPTTPPLFSPTHRPMLATSASFRRDSSHQSRGPSSALPDTDDPWRGIDSPKQVTRSVSEGTPTSTPWSKGSEILSSRKGFSGSITSVKEDVFTVSDHRAAMDVTNPLGDPTVVIHIPPVLIPSTPNSKGKGKAKDVDRPNLFRSVSVLASMVETSNGRDKVLKCIQYSARTYLYIHVLIGIFRKAPPAQRRHIDRLRTMISGLSLTRKCLLLFNFLAPLSHLLSDDPIPGPTFMTHIISLFSGLADDTFCLSRLGVVSKRRGQWADKWSNRLWLLTSVIGLTKLYTTQLPILTSLVQIGRHETDINDEKTSTSRKALQDAVWTARKLWCDVVFASYDVFSLQLLKEPVLCATGLTAGLISTSKLYEKHALKVQKEQS